MSNQIDGIPCSDPMNVAMSAAPTGAATEAKQDTQITAEQATATATGTTVDAPVADNTTAASATAATGIGLWKRLVNLGIAILAKLPTVGTAGTASSNVVTVQGIASGTTLPVTASLAAAQTLATVTTVSAVTAITNALPAGTNAIGKLAANSGVDIGDVDVTSIAAGENVLGKTVGVSTIVTSTVTMSVAGSYATGDYIGTTTSPQAFTNASRVSGTGTGIIKSIRISDKNTTAAVAMELWVFSATFVAPTDNAAWAISDAEAFTCLGVIPISTSKWYASSNNKVYSDDTLALAIKPAATSLFYALVARGTTPSWTSGDLDIGLGILLD